MPEADRRGGRCSGMVEARGRLYACVSSRRRHTRFDCDWSSDVCSSDLAQSFWTTDSGTYWKSDIFDSPTPKGTCPRSITGFSVWSDAPDGPMVEKGGVAEVIRKEIGRASCRERV